MATKGEVTDQVINFYQMVQTQFEQSIKIFRSDNGTEFLTNKLSDFLSSVGCVHQTTCPYTPQQNGVAERKHRHLLEVGRALKFQANIPDCLWGDCILTATYIINRLPSATINNKTPFEVLTSKVPTYNNMKVFGCLCYATNLSPHKDKFETRARPCVFLGYPFGQKGYKLLDLQTQKFLVSRDVVFKEHCFPFHENQEVTNSADTIPLPFFNPSSFDRTTDPDHDNVRISIQDSTNDFSRGNSETDSSGTDPDGDTSLSITPQNLRKSSRVSQPPAHLRDFICTTVSASPDSTRYPLASYVNYSGCSDAFQHRAMQVISDIEPSSYSQASKSPEWVSAMQTELKALEENHTWMITDLPPGKNIVGCRWVYKVKRHSNGSVERFKARLVAKGFTQEEGIDYHETFAPVVKMTTVRIFLTVAISKQWPIYQLDVNNAFLHGDLDEEVYMALLTGFYKDQKTSGKVCKLLKPIYGLKQASR